MALLAFLLFLVQSLLLVNTPTRAPASYSRPRKAYDIIPAGVTEVVSNGAWGRRLSLFRVVQGHDHRLASHIYYYGRILYLVPAGQSAEHRYTVRLLDPPMPTSD